MKISPRKLALSVAVSLAITTIGACRDDTSKPVGDVLAQDSSLDLAVMSATGDSMKKAGADTPVAIAPASVAGTPAAPARSTPLTVAANPPAATRVASSVPSHRVIRSGSASRIRETRRSSARLARSRSTVSDKPARSTVVYRRPARSVSAKQTSVAVSAEPTLSPGNKVVYSAPASVTRSSSAMIPIGSSLSLVTNEKICTSSAKVGDRFNARLVKQIVSPSGVTIPEGSTATGEVIALPGDDARMRVAIRSIEYNGRSYPVGSETSYTDMKAVKVQPAGGSTSRVLAGAGIGAIIGRVIGGDTRSTMIGAAGGAVAGGVVANRSVRYDQCVPSGGQIVAHLTQPLRVDLGE